MRLMQKVFGTSLLFLFIAPLTFAAPLFAPGETLNPSCAPTDPDCTVTAPAISGINNDITKLQPTGDLVLNPSSGLVGIGVLAPAESLHLAGGLLLGVASGTTNGTIRWTGSDFEGRKNDAWTSFTVPWLSQVASFNTAADNRFTINLAATTTDALTEGSVNLYFTDARADARITVQKGQLNGLAELDSGGKVPSSQLPSLAFTNVYAVADITSRDALVVNKGDVAVVADAGSAESRSYIWDGAAWLELKSPLSLSLIAANNLSDLASIATARTNLGLGTSDIPTFGGLTLTTPLSVANGGTGSVTLTGVVHGNGTGSFTAGNVNLGSEVDGTLPTIRGGTGLSAYASGDILYASAINTLSALPIGSSGQVLTVSGGVPVWATSASAPVSSVFGRTGAVISQSNDYTWAQIDKTVSSLADIATRNISDTTGTLAVSRGGTGQTSYTNGQLLIGNSTGSTLNKSTLTAGSGVSVTNGSGSITLAATAINTVGNRTTATVDCANANLSPTVSQILHAIITCTPSVTRTITLPTAQGSSGLVQALPGTPAVGDIFVAIIANLSSSKTLTIAGGTGVTIGGSTTIPSDITRSLYCRVTSVTSGSETVTCY